MDFTNTFTIPVGIDDAFAVLTDLERVAPCMPGAALESADGDTYTGRVKVKVGPMSLTYRGTAEVVDKDLDAHTARISARGNEARGGGTASADVSASLEEVEDGTQVVVTTNIEVTGKPAQFGRGVMADVGKKIIDKFAECLAGKLGDGGDEASAEDASADTSASEGEDAGSDTSDDVSTDTSDAAGSATTATASSPAAAAAVGASSKSRRIVPTEPEAEALDLMEVAGAATAKRVLPLVAVVLAALAAIWFWRRDR